MDNLQFIWSGESELPAGWALQPHVHDFFHLAYVQRGALIFHADGVPYPLSHGSLILLPPGVTHAIPGDSHNLCSQIEVMFRLTDPLLQGLLDTRTVRALHDAAHLEPLFSYIQLHYTSADPLRIQCTASFLQTILFSLLTGDQNSCEDFVGYVDPRGYSPLVQHILTQIEKEFNSKYDLSRLALSLGFNKNYLCTVFRRETGITISEYVNYRRIRAILITLQYNGYIQDVPMHALANEFGYGNASYFNRVFKKFTGMTPTEFMDALSAGTDSREPTPFQKYYTQHLDLKSFPIRESLAYMQGLKAAAEGQLPG